MAEVAGSVERVKASVGDLRRVTEVMQPCGGFEPAGVVAEDGSERAGLRGDTLDVSPAARKRDFEELACQFSGPVCLAHGF